MRDRDKGMDSSSPGAQVVRGQSEFVSDDDGTAANGKPCFLPPITIGRCCKWRRPRVVAPAAQRPARSASDPSSAAARFVPPCTGAARSSSEATAAETGASRRNGVQPPLVLPRRLPPFPFPSGRRRGLVRGGRVGALPRPFRRASECGFGRPNRSRARGPTRYRNSRLAPPAPSAALSRRGIFPSRPKRSRSATPLGRAGFRSDPSELTRSGGAAAWTSPGAEARHL